MRPTLYLLMGLPGAGKSTYRATLKDCGDRFVVVSSDDIIEAEAAKVGKTYNEIFQSAIGAATAESNRLFNEALHLGRNVIVDKTLLTRKARQRFIYPASGKNYRVVVRYFAVTDWRAHMAVLAERAEKSGKMIPEHVLNTFRQQTEYPTYSEGIDVIEIVKPFFEESA